MGEENSTPNLEVLTKLAPPREFPQPNQGRKQVEPIKVSSR